MDLEQIKKKLLAEKKLVEKELAAIGIFDKTKKDWAASGSPVEETDRSEDNLAADYSEEFGEKVATVEMLEFRKKDLDLALEKIKKGTYGKCEIDGEPIEEERLLANPAARTCIKHREAIQPEHISAKHKH